MAKNKNNNFNNGKNGKFNKEADCATKGNHQETDHAKKASTNQHEKFGKHAGKSELGQKEQVQGDWKGNSEKSK